MFPNLVNILKVDLKFLLFVRYHNVFCGEVTYKVVNCSYDIHDGDNDGEEDVDDDGGKCGEVTYEVVEGSDSQKPGGIISRRETGGELDDDVQHWLYFNSSWYLWNLSLKEMSEIHDIHEICGHGGGEGWYAPLAFLNTTSVPACRCEFELSKIIVLQIISDADMDVKNIFGKFVRKSWKGLQATTIIGTICSLRRQVESIERQNQKNEPVS